MKQSRKNNILILEPRTDGHHGPYLQWMATGLVKRGFHVTVITSPDSLSHPSIQAIEAAARADNDTVLNLITAESSFVDGTNRSDSTSGLLTRELAYWRLFRRWYRAHVGGVRPDVVFLPYLDYCLHAVGLLGSPFGDCPWVGLAMRPSFHYRRMGVIAPRPPLGALKKALFMRLLRNRHLRRLLTIDEPLAQYLAASPKLASKATFFPEPAELGRLPNPSDAKQRLGVPVGRKLILIYGAITARKGVLELLHAMLTPGFPVAMDILLAGKIDAEVNKILRSKAIVPLVAQGRVHVLNRFIEATEEPYLFAAADAVWVGYRGHYGSSGVLMQAIYSGRPVIACQEGVLGWLTERYSLGNVVCPSDAYSVVRGVQSLAGCSEGERTARAYIDRPIVCSFESAVESLSEVMSG
ncbi:hypothetical protein [Salinisphaera sp. LB1]|uniref:hypothetical protein n=1 Tax=Salinisphaera sp. LB1 TaxID=2183911 RepID=UPI000D70592E|nr:hypothetical protein [Salinisphaera sp. LB1]AWN17522.1 Transcriptional regulator [Salinisphaera sp. LB1]